VFEPNTRLKRANIKRLLIVDGHNSHINLRFISWAVERGIFILILPPHSTHRLQPLDVNCFSPLSIAYGIQLNQWLHKGLGIVSFTKRDFLTLFRTAWATSFTLANIQGGFAKAGIWPFNPQLVLDAITRRPATPPQIEVALKPPPTPMTSKSIRRAQKAYKANPTKQNLDLILRSQERLAAQHEVDKHIQSGLFKSLKNEKKRRQRGKRLNLVGEEDSGAQLFHTSRVRVAQAFAAEKEAAIQAEKAAKAEKKALVVQNKQRKALEAEERAVQRQVNRELKAQKQADKVAAKKLKKREEQLPKGTEKESLIVVLLYKKTSNQFLEVATFAEPVQVVVEGEGSKTTSTRTRSINLPSRFKDL
jgi:hypothetical protein